VKFSVSGKDTVSISGIIPSLPAKFSPTGLLVKIDAGGATRSFTLDAKGKARTLEGSFALKLKSVKNAQTKQLEFIGGPAPFKASLKAGAWMAAWSDEGVDSQGSAKNAPMTLIVDVTLGGRVYTFTANVLYSAKADVGGKFKK
jgi:hypothetical protein